MSCSILYLELRKTKPSMQSRGNRKSNPLNINDGAMINMIVNNGQAPLHRNVKSHEMTTILIQMSISNLLCISINFKFNLSSLDDTRFPFTGWIRTGVCTKKASLTGRSDEYRRFYMVHKTQIHFETQNVFAVERVLIIWCMATDKYSSTDNNNFFLQHSGQMVLLSSLLFKGAVTPAHVGISMTECLSMVKLLAYIRLKSFAKL